MSEKSLPPHLQALLDAERSRQDAPEEARAAARANLAALLGPTLGLGNPAPGDASVQHARATAARAAPSFLRGAKALSAAKVTGILALGGLAGGGLSRALSSPEVRVVYVDRPAPALSVTALLTPSASAEQPLVPAASASSHASAPASAGSAPAEPRSKDTDLATERAFLERARSALARGDGPGALTAIQAHGQAFPHGQLVEEREVLAVQALAAAGRAQEAAARAARFRALFPKSLMLPVVDQALR